MAYEEPGYVVVRAAVDYEIRRYSGRWSEDRYREHEMMLMQSLDRDGVETHGSPLFTHYNGPWTPWFMRCNQVMIPMTDESL